MQCHVRQISHMTPSQQASMFNCENTVCCPIDWDTVLAPTCEKWSPHSVRDYLNTVCDRMNHFFAVIMSGPKMGSIQVTRLNRASNDLPPINVILSIWRCQQLFTKTINMLWKENGKTKRLRMTAFNLWMRSSNRKNIQQRTSMPTLPATPATDWLKRMLSLAKTDACPIQFGTENPRQLVYESFWEVVGVHRKEQWSPRRISSALYRLLPLSKPTKRVRLKGVSVIYIPSQEMCYDTLEHLKITPLKI